ncbi:hypothetical protein G9A89_010932 [Geosiphon pyriformis]|nr:hypothetical protein G9A89_010932 [Geosiphon pyriformis]
MDQTHGDVSSPKTEQFIEEQIKEELSTEPSSTVSARNISNEGEIQGSSFPTKLAPPVKLIRTEESSKSRKVKSTLKDMGPVARLLQFDVEECFEKQGKVEKTSVLSSKESSGQLQGEASESLEVGVFMKTGDDSGVYVEKESPNVIKTHSEDSSKLVTQTKPISMPAHQSESSEDSSPDLIPYQSVEDRKRVFEIDIGESFPGYLSKKHKSFAGRQLDESMNKRQKHFPMLTKDDLKLQERSNIIPTLGLSDAVLEIRRTNRNKYQSQIGGPTTFKGYSRNTTGVKSQEASKKASQTKTTSLSVSISTVKIDERKKQAQDNTFENFMKKVYPHAQKSPPNPVPITPYAVQLHVEPLILPELSFFRTNVGESTNFTNKGEEVNRKGKQKAI